MPSISRARRDRILVGIIDMSERNRALAHGGEISFANKPDAGAVFRFTLPAAGASSL